ncbi:MAG: kinesin-domain-containing protein, partial [Lentinula lateritia]
MSTQPVQIVARIRPPLLNEHTDDAISVVPIPADHTLSAARPLPFSAWVSVSSTGTKTGTTQVQNSQTAFHTAFGPDTTQLELFDTAVAPHLAPLLKGHTLTILAYGPTSSGKTHTMEGSPAEPGIIPRSVGVLFEMSEEGKESGMISSFEVHMSYLELYKDDAFDLLVSQRTHEKLPIRTNAKGETFVVGLTRVPIKSFDDWKNVFRTASQNRTTGATLLNRASSRSHAMLSIEVELIAAPTSETREMTYNGKINLVDLAGSENNKHTGNSLANPTRLAESAAINKSLSTLGQVVHALNTGASRIPYRDSNLTRLLSASLGGKALGKTILLCNLAPGVKFRSDVLNTLNFASRTKNIETKTVVNEREKPAPIEVVKEKEFLPTTGSLMRRTSIQSRRVSASHIPAPGSRIPSYGSGGHSRLSGFGLGPAAGVGIGGLGVKAGIDDADLNERINKAVEAEVKRRLEEKEAQRKEEEEAREKQLQQEKSRPHITPSSSSSSTSSKQDGSASMFSNSTSSSTSLSISASGPGTESMSMSSSAHVSGTSDILRNSQTSLTAAAAGLLDSTDDAESVARMSLAERKKMGKIYVDLARGYSAKNDLATALSLYRHAALFVPDNTRLSERIIDVEWAVRNGKSYVPTPKRQHPREGEELKLKPKSSRSSKSHR